jgi:hypothetical protein
MVMSFFPIFLEGFCIFILEKVNPKNELIGNSTIPQKVNYKEPKTKKLNAGNF